MASLVGLAACVVLVCIGAVSQCIAQPRIKVSRAGITTQILSLGENEAWIDVTTPDGRTIGDLNAAEITVTDSVGRRAKVISVERGKLRDARSFDISFVLDNSASMFSSYDSLTKYLDTVLAGVPGDPRMTVYTFDYFDRTPTHEPTNRKAVFIASSRSTTDRDSIKAFWHFYDSIRADFTPLYDELASALWRIQETRERGDTTRIPIVILVSDGSDNASRTRVETLADLLKVSAARLFSITYRTDQDRHLAWLTSRSGGSHFNAATLPALNTALAEVRDELLSGYRIRYRFTGRKRGDKKQGLSFSTAPTR